MTQSAANVKGTVTQFDVRIGLGEVTATDGTVWPFHCVSISDGTRNIAVGTPVVFDIQFHVVRDEAFNIRPQ